MNPTPTTPLGTVTNPAGGVRAATQWKKGVVLRCRSEQFGVHDLLCIKCPSPHREEACRFIEVFHDGQTREALNFSSVQGDLVEKEWPTLASYYEDSALRAAVEKALAAWDEARLAMDDHELAYIADKLFTALRTLHEQMK